MKINWHWGTKLLVAMILFMLLLITMVYMSMQQTYHLVERDYYPKALEYQDRIDKTSNADKLGEKVRIDQSDGIIYFTFPASLDPGKVRGSIMFYRPSDESMDLTFSIAPDTSGRQACNLVAVPKGKYIVKIDYEADGAGYFQEETLLLKMQ
jgi:hypothetical protein